MNICGSLMDIFDYPQARSANKYCFTKLNEIKNNPFLEKTIRLYRLLYIIGVPFRMKITKFLRLLVLRSTTR